MDNLEFNSKGLSPQGGYEALSLIGIDENHPAWGLIGKVYLFSPAVKVGEIVLLGVEEDNGVIVGPSLSLRYKFKVIYWGSGLGEAHKLRLVGMKLMRVAIEENASAPTGTPGVYPGGIRSVIKERVEGVWVFVRTGEKVSMSLPGPNRVGFTNCVAIPVRLMPVRVHVRSSRADE
jgi:hypothetical protein